MKSNPCILRQRNTVFLAIFGAAFAIASNVVFAADYTFDVEPAYPTERINEIYKPLMTYLNKATGEHFTLVTARNYHFYWRDIQAGAKADFAFDEAHLTDYRIQHGHYEPLVHTAEPTSYTLVTNVEIGNKGVAGLVGHSIVTMPAPSLGYTLLLEFYPNPVLQPDIRSSAASSRDAVDSVFAGEADAAMIPTWLKEQYPNLTPVKTSRQFAGQCVSAAPTVPDDVKAKVKDALLKLDADQDTAKLLFELGVTKFVPATAKDYAGSEQMLKNYFGYK
ncbi:MAG: PhnD/SsuA/transferrin family substrate-binding protein [Rudaea sp.]|nr:PhnD/SsuA/transferrin family substrate-binding protein [Rudaea sp.]